MVAGINNPYLISLYTYIDSLNEGWQADNWEELNTALFWPYIIYDSLDVVRNIYYISRSIKP